MVSMELRDVSWMDWRCGLYAGCFGLALGCLLRMVVMDPWVGVHVAGAAMAWFMAKASMWSEENEALRGEIAELQKTVMVVKSTMHEMAMMNRELEAVNRGIGWRTMVRRQSSANSL